MANKAPRYFDNLDNAIKEAKSRARTMYASQYIYDYQTQNNQTVYFVRGIQMKNVTPLAKVKFDGTVEQLDQNQEEAK